MGICQARCKVLRVLCILLLYGSINNSLALSPDGEALLSFRSAIVTSDGSILQWRPEDPDPCRWKGVTCDSESKRVIYLSLAHQKLSGSISPYLGKLEHLRILTLRDNNFYGPIPSELGNCTELQGIYLQRNYLSDSIPSELGNLSNLGHLNLSGNLLRGSIPPSLGKLNKLVTFDVSANFLAGPIPSDGVLINFPESSFGGNRGLCGKQIKVACNGGSSTNNISPTS
ncbi:hypothetical protein CRG98_034268, partial [Punica granatum]